VCTRECGIGEAGGTFDFVAVSGYAEMLSGWLAGVAPAHLERIDKEIASHGGTKSIIQVKSMSFTSLVGARAVVDFVSIDVEGHEIEVLRGIDFKNVFVKLFIIEFNSEVLRAELEEFLESVGYEIVGGKPVNGHNLAFSPSQRAADLFDAATH
jgi:FkbM family methyltransferase